MRVPTTLPLALALVVSCGPEDGPAGADASQFLTSVTDEPPGANCESGGVAIDYGWDADGDEALGDGEIAGTTYLCGGADAEGVVVTDEAVFEPGPGCRDGYQVIDIGTDNGDGGGTAGDGVLQEGEVDSTLVECLPPDVDEDGARNLVDNCPELANAGQEDADLDFQGDACDPSNDPFELWGVGDGGEGSSGSSLYRIDLTTDTYTEVGDIGYDVTNIAVNPADGELYGFTRVHASVAPYTLVRIDTSTGAGSEVAQYFYDLDGGEGLHIGAMAFLSDGSLYGTSAASEGLVELDMVGGFEPVAAFEPWGSGLCALPTDQLLGFGGDGSAWWIDPGVGIVPLGMLGGEGGDGGEGYMGTDLNPDNMVIAGVRRWTGQLALARAYTGSAPPVVYHTIDFDDVYVHSVAFVED